MSDTIPQPPGSANPSAADMVERLLTESNRQRRIRLYRAFSADIGLVQLLKDEVDRLKDANGQQALAAGERAFELASWLAEPTAEALGNWALALGLTVQGRFEEALMRFEQARTGYLALGQPQQAARVALRQVQAQAMTGEYNLALALITEASDTFLAAGLQSEAGLAFNNKGAIHTRLSQFDLAEQAFVKALERLALADEVVGIAQTHVNLGYVCQELDRFREARGHLEKALAIFQQLDMQQSVAGTTLDLALLYRREGHLNAALTMLSKSRNLYHQLGASHDANLAQLEEARVHLELNLLEEAEALAEDLIRGFGERDMQLEALEASSLLGSIRARAGRLPEALEVLEQSRDGWSRLDNDVRAARVEAQLAALHLQLARGGAADSIALGLELVNSSLSVLTGIGSRSGRAVGLITLAELLSFQGHSDEASRTLDEAATIVADLRVPDLTIEVKRLLGRWAMQAGRSDVAEARFLEGIEVLESVRATLAVDEFKASYFGDRLGVYGDLIDLLLHNDRQREAFAYVERAKARALVDLLAGGNYLQPLSDDPAVEQLTRELEAAREELNWHYLRAEKDSEEHWKKVTSSENRVTALLRELERLQPQASGFQVVSVPDLDAVISELDADTVLLEYFAIEGKIMAFIVTTGNVHVSVDIATISEVKERLGQLQIALNRSSNGAAYAEFFGEKMLAKGVDGALRSLHELLIAPVRELLTRHKLIVIPHGPLNAVPFAALFDGERYLLDSFELSYAPSAMVYGLCRRQPARPGGSLVAFGVPIEDIPAVQYEIETVVEMFTDAEALVGVNATRESFRQRAPAAQILHVATHGTFRPGNPMFSGLRMADGWLTARDIYSMRLRSSLVVLSACETGLTSGTFGDEMMGLTRGFLNAGAPSLTVSHWAVKDEHTAQLMIEFYRGLARGESVASALRLAQLALRVRYPNPYHWAAFAVIGDPERTVDNGKAS